MKKITKAKTKAARRVKGVQVPVGVRKTVDSDIRKIAGRGEDGKFTKGEPTLFETVENPNGVDVILEGAIQFNGREVIRNKSSQTVRIRNKRDSQTNKMSREIAKGQRGTETSEAITDDSLMAMAE